MKQKKVYKKIKSRAGVFEKFNKIDKGQQGEKNTSRPGK